MSKFNLDQGQKYRASISLGLMESFATNDMIASEMTKAGFTEVTVEGFGSSRVAQGVWSRESMRVKLPEQVQEIVALA